MIARAILEDLRDRTCRSFRVCVRRADKRFPMTSPQVEREIGGRIKQARGWSVDLDDAELTVHVELLTSEAFYFFGKERGAGGLPTGTAGRVACLLVRRHRLAGGRAPHDEARLRGQLRSLSQLSRSCRAPRGEGARARPQLLTTWQQRSTAVSGGVRRDPAAGGAGDAGSDAGDRLSAADAAHRGADRACARCAGAGDRRRRRPGRVADAREPAGDRQCRDAADLPAADWHGQGRDHGRGAGARHLSISIIPDQDCCTLFTPRNPRDARARSPTTKPQRERCRSTNWSSRRWPARSWKTLDTQW